MLPKVLLMTPDDYGPNPQGLYIVAKTPAPLAGMAYPKKMDWGALSEQGIRWVVNLTESNPGYDPSPLSILLAVSMQDQSGGFQPVDGDRERESLDEVIRTVTSRLRAGEGVAVHCQGGTGRTGTVLACVLRRLGLPIEAVIDQMHAINKARLKYPGWSGWPESDWQRRALENFFTRSVRLNGRRGLKPSERHDRCCGEFQCPFW